MECVFMGKDHVDKFVPEDARLVLAIRITRHTNNELRLNVQQHCKQDWAKTFGSSSAILSAPAAVHSPSKSPPDKRFSTTKVQVENMWIGSKKTITHFSKRLALMQK